MKEVILMPTKNPRVMVVLEPPLQRWLKMNAEKQGISVSSMIRDIIRDTYRESENEQWVKEGEARLATFDRRKAVSHNDAWKE
jgi:hypothetical protein